MKHRLEKISDFIQNLHPYDERCFIHRIIYSTMLKVSMTRNCMFYRVDMINVVSAYCYYVGYR
jgi:hypothetical protein